MRSSTGRYTTAFASRGAASARKNPDDSKNRNSGPGKAIHLSDTKGTEHVNVRLAPYGKDRLLLSWESLKNAKCKDGTLTWASVPVTPSYATPLTGASPTTKTLKIARLKP